jgi:hypothetical protein
MELEKEKAGLRERQGVLSEDVRTSMHEEEKLKSKHAKLLADHRAIKAELDSKDEAMQREQLQCKQDLNNFNAIRNRIRVRAQR